MTLGMKEREGIERSGAMILVERTHNTPHNLPTKANGFSISLSVSQSWGDFYNFNPSFPSFRYPLE